MKDHFDALTAHQASRLVESVDSMVSEANESAGTQRKITALAAATVVRRSLASTHGLDHSIREHRALADLSDYISLAQRNQSRSLVPSNTDLLPVSHPRSTRSHSMTYLGLFQAQARWFACDPRVLDENRSLVAAAIISEPGSIEHTYATSRISAASDGSLLAVLLASVYSGGNSRAARSARARAQRRDRYGRFAFQGGALRLNIRMPDGTVRSFSGRIAALSSDGVSFDIETDDGTLYRVPANFSEAVKAILPGGGDGFSDSAATTKTGDPVLDYAELPRLDLPSGYKRTDDGTDPNRETYETEAGDYIVEKSMQDGKPSYRVFRNDDDRTEVGTFDSWTKANSEVIKDGKKGNKEAAIKARLEGKDSPEAEYDDYLGGIERAAEDEDSDAAVTKNAKNVLDYINDDFLQDGDTPEKLAERLRLTADAIEEGLVNGDADYVEDLRDAADAVERKAAKRSGKEQDQPAFEPYEVPEGAYDLKNPAEFEPKGRTNQDSPDYTDDPAELAQKFSEDELLDGLSEALFNPEGAGPLSFDGGDEDVPAEAIYNALAEQGADAELITADLYDAGFEDNSAPNSKRIRDRRSKKEQGKKAEIPQEGEKEKTDWKPSDTRKEIPYDTIEWEDDGQGGGRAINKSGSTEILDIAGRKVVVVNVNGQDVPFYLSTGSGGKKGVEAGKWYPFFGLGPDDGWINKTSEAEINDYYGSPELRAMAEWLDANVGDVRDDQSIPKAKATGSHVDFINESLGIDPANNQESDTKTKVDANIAEIKKRISEGSGDSAQPKAQIPESADEKSNLPSEEKITDLPQQQRDADVENTASKLHDIWREGRKNEDGSYEPRMKDDGQGGEVDIANTDYADLPEKWQAENRASADHVVNLLRDEQAPADQDPMEWAAEEVHKSWLDRNGSWAPEEQKLPYTQLSEEEKQKDRDVVQAALDVLGMDSPKQKSDSDGGAEFDPQAILDKLKKGRSDSLKNLSDEELQDAIDEAERQIKQDLARWSSDGRASASMNRLAQLIIEQDIRRAGLSPEDEDKARELAADYIENRRFLYPTPASRIVNPISSEDMEKALDSAYALEDFISKNSPNGYKVEVGKGNFLEPKMRTKTTSRKQEEKQTNPNLEEPASVELRMTTDEDLPVVPGEADPYADEDFPPTQEQKDIVDAVLTGDDVVVRALAGTGKTSTLKLIARRLKKDSPLKKIIYIAFNKSVQVEAEAKMPDNVESRTADSIAWRWADKKITGKRNKKDNIVKIKDIAAHLGVDNTPDPNNPGEWFSPTEAVVYARKAVDKFTISADDEIGPQHFEGGSSPELLDLAKRMWADYSSPEGRLGIKNNHVTKMWALSRPDLSDSASGVTKGADIIFFDEAQDINPVLAKVVADQKIQKIYVGDENQAIYGFRGAEDELQNVKAPHDLALTKSWRFGPQIAGMGNRFLEFLGSKRRVEGGGPNGEILDSGTMEDADAILVRTNAGALQAIMEELDRGRSVGVAAKYKEELQRLVDTAEWLKNGGDPRSKPRDIHEDLVQFSSWKEVLDASKEENVNYDPKVAMLAGMVESQGIDGMRDILDRVKIASSKEDGNEAGVAPLTQADAEDGASGKIADGVDYNIEGSKIVLSGKGMFPVKEKLKASGFRWNPENKTWWRNEDSPEERLTMLTNLRNKVGGVVEAQPVDVVVSTAHKAKGLEWDRVRIGDDFRKPKENEFGQPMIAPEEVRLAYVAVTRARKALDPGSLDWIYKYEGRNLNPNQDETTETPSASPDQPDAPDTGLPEPEQQDAPERTPASRVQVQPTDLQSGDVVINDRPDGREYFIVDEVREGGEKGKLIIIGHYPGHQQQEKQWNKNLKGGLNIVRGADVPPPGDGPELHKPDIKEYLEKDDEGRVKKGQWVKDENDQWYVPNPEKQAEYRAAMDAVLADIVEASKGFDDPTRGETADQPAPAPKKPKAPFPPGAAPLQGRLAELAREANGDPKKFRELLSAEKVYVFDFETTGIVKDENGKMVSPGQPWAVSIAQIDPMTGDVIEQKTIYMNPGEPLGDWAKENLKDADGNPLTDEWLAGQADKADAFAEVTEFLKSDTNPILIGHNIDFDEPILRENAEKLGLYTYSPAGMGDTMSLSRYLQREDQFAKNTLGALANKYKIENPDWHNAENDVKITAKIFDALLKDFEDNGIPFDMDAMQEWHDARVAEFEQKKEAFENVIAQEKASSLVAEAIHSGNKPDIDKAVSEVVNDIQRVESPVPAQNDDEYIASQLDDDESAVEADQRAALGARPGIADGPVEREIGIGVYFELDNGDRISIIDDGFGNKESAYLKTDGDGHKVLHWSIQKWNPDDSDEDIANGVLDDLYGSKKTSSDPDVESASPETQSSDLPPFIDLPPATPDPELNQANEDLVEAKKIVFELNKVDNLDGEMGEALADAIEDFFNIADNGFEFDNARRGAKDIERIAANLDDVAELGEERNLEVGSLARLAENIRGFAQNLRRRGGSGRVRGGDVAQRQPQPDAKATPPEARVDGTNGGGVRTPRNPGERARGITKGSNLPGVPMGETVEAVAPDGRRLLRRNRENRNFWDHPLASLPRRRFNKPWEGQFVDQNNIPIADKDVVHFYKKDRFGRIRRGVVIGRKDNVVRQNGPNRDFVLVRWDDGRTGFYVSHHLEIQNPDLDWRFLVNPDEERNDPASKRMNLPPGLNWDDFRAGEAPRNTRGQNGQLRGEGRNRNNLPVNEGDDLQKFERHELEGHITDTDGAIIYIGDRVEHVGKVGEKRGLVSGVVIGKKLVKVDNVNYGYQPIVRWDTPGVPVKNWSAKALRVLNADKADRKIGDEQANIPVLKKGKKGEGQDGWIPDPDNGPNEPINPPPPPVYAIDNVIFGMAGEAGARALNVANRLPEEDRGQALELVAAIAALRDGINAGVNPDKIAEAVSEVSGMAKKFSDAVKKDRDLNAPDDEGAEPARYFMGFARVLDAYAKDLRARGEAKPRNDFDVSGMEARTGILAGDIKVGDKVDISGFVAVVNSIHDMPNGESVSVSMVYPNGNGRVYIAKKNEPFMAAVFRDKKTSKDDGTEPFIPRDFRRVDTTAKDLAVGDFIPTKKGNYGRITDIEVSDRNGAVKVTVEYENGNSFTYNWMGKNTPIEGALIPDGARVPQAKKPVEDKEAPAAPAAPEAPEVVNEPQMPANIENPVVDRAGNRLSVGQVVRHNNDKKAKELGNGVIVKFEKDPKYGKDVVKVRFSDGSVKKFRADRVLGQDQGQQQKPQVGEKRPARDYEDVLLLADKLIPSSKKVNIKIVLDNDRDLSDLDLKTRMLINKYAPAMLSDINRRGDNKQAKDMANLVFALNKIHLEQNPSPEGLGPIGEELFNFDISDVIRQIDKYGNRPQAGTIIPIKDTNGKDTDWHVETLNMGAIGYTFFMVHKSGQKFIVKRERNEKNAAKEVVGAAVARGLGVPGATFVTIHPGDNKVSIQTYAGGSEPLSGPAQMGRSLKNQDSADIPVDNIIRMLLLDGLIDNGDRHGGNYLFGEISDSGEREVHVFPIDMGLGAFSRGGGLAKQNRFDPVNMERSRLQDFGSLTLEEISKMSLQELIQYLRRYADPGTPNKLIRDYAQNMIDKAEDVILSGIPGRFFGI